MASIQPSPFGNPGGPPDTLDQIDPVTTAPSGATGRAELFNKLASFIFAAQKRIVAAEAKIVTTINGKTGSTITLTASDVGADPAGSAAAAQTAAEAASDPAGTAATAVAAEQTRAETAESANATAIAAETTRAEAAEAANAAAIANETTRAEAAEAAGFRQETHIVTTTTNVTTPAWAVYCEAEVISGGGGGGGAGSAATGGIANQAGGGGGSAAAVTRRIFPVNAGDVLTCLVSAGGTGGTGGAAGGNPGGQGGTGGGAYIRRSSTSEYLVIAMTGSSGRQSTANSATPGVGGIYAYNAPASAGFPGTGANATAYAEGSIAGCAGGAGGGTATATLGGGGGTAAQSPNTALTSFVLAPGAAGASTTANGVAGQDATMPGCGGGGGGGGAPGGAGGAGGKGGPGQITLVFRSA